jgi:hypothetical protein
MSDEVLVHISTPATRQNDELFRSLANAYIDFEPHRLYRDNSVRKRARVNQTLQRRSGISSTEARSSATRETFNPSAPSASKEPYGSFLSNVPSNEYGLDEDDSVRSISRLAQLDRSYLSWRKRATPKSSVAPSEAELQTSSDSIDADTGFIEDSQSALQALQSQLQDTYSTTSADTSEDGDSEDELLSDMERQSPSAPNSGLDRQRSTDEELPLPASSQDHVQIKRGSKISIQTADDHTRMTQDPQIEHTQIDLDESALLEPTDLFSRAISAADDGFEDARHQLDFCRLPKDAFPPPPTTSVARPGTLPSQITKHLAVVKNKNLARFKPLKVQRDLENDERGFWRVDCTRWASNVQREFWLSLCEHVCSGRAGWATTLHRETGSNDNLGLVRLYCWGEVVEHMWILLWLCSKGKAAGIGSKWIDANGMAVVEMT